MNYNAERYVTWDGIQSHCRDVLVVDDLVDTGTTLKLLRGILSDSMVVTLFAKPGGESLVDLYHEKN